MLKNKLTWYKISGLNAYLCHVTSKSCPGKSFYGCAILLHFTQAFKFSTPMTSSKRRWQIRLSSPLKMIRWEVDKHKFINKKYTRKQLEFIWYKFCVSENVLKTFTLFLAVLHLIRKWGNTFRAHYFQSFLSTLIFYQFFLLNKIWFVGWLVATKNESSEERVTLDARAKNDYISWQRVKTFLQFYW